MIHPWRLISTLANDDEYDDSNVIQVSYTYTTVYTEDTQYTYCTVPSFCLHEYLFCNLRPYISNS